MPCAFEASRSCDSFVFEFLHHHVGKLFRQVRKQPGERLSHNHGHASGMECFGHLQTDVPHADDERLFDLTCGQIILDASTVFQRFQGQHSRQLRAGQIQAHRPSAGGYQEFVVLNLKGLAFGSVPQDLPAGPVDAFYLVPQANIYALLFPEDRSRDGPPGRP